MKTIRLLFFAFLFALPATGQTAAGGKERLIQDILRLEARYGGHLGFMAADLATGDTVSYNASERFPTASVIKLPILVAFYQLVDQGKIDPNEVVVLTKADMKPGSGILQLLSGGDRITLLDAVKLMITQSDNTATNLVLDRLAPTHQERLNIVNEFMSRQGLKNTRLLNRLFSLETKQRTPEAVRYGVGVSTPEDMVALLKALNSRTLVSPAACDAMVDILKSQFYREMIPRYLPEGDCQFLEIANKTGSVNETKVDVALIHSDKANIALAIFVDKHPDHRGDVENRGILLGSMVARTVWNYFTGSTGYEERKVPLNSVDWNSFPGGRWGIYRSSAAPFPSKQRKRGFRAPGGSFYPYHPHYDDNSIVVVVPETFRETEAGVNVIVHFHGELGDNLMSLEQGRIPESMIAGKTNAILVLPQGPYRARDACGGKMTEKGGLKSLIEDMLVTMKGEKVVETGRLRKLLISADGFGYLPAAGALIRGGLEDHVTDVFLIDALNKDPRAFRDWLNQGSGTLHVAYSTGLAREAAGLEATVSAAAKQRLRMTSFSTDHLQSVGAFFASWLKELGPDWKSER